MERCGHAGARTVRRIEQLRLLCTSILENNHVMVTEKSIKYSPERSALKYQAGDEIARNVVTLSIAGLWPDERPCPGGTGTRKPRTGPPGLPSPVNEQPGDYLA